MLNPAKILFATLALFGTASPAIAAEPGLFPGGCGGFRVLGTLHEKPLRLVIWEGTASEKVLPIEGDCRKCPLLRGSLS